MKRLLEWKQRMLQSPLTRKPNGRPDGTVTPQPRTNNEAYRQQVSGRTKGKASEELNEC